MKDSHRRYAWVILAVSFLTLAINQGARGSYGIFMESLIKEFGWSRAAASLPPTVALVVTGLTQLPAGRLVDLYGVRLVMNLGVLLCFASILPLVAVGQLWQFVLFFGVLAGLSSGGTGTVPNTVLVSQWFDQNRGLALGIVSAGISAGAIAMAPILGGIVEGSGWRAGYLFVAALLLFVNLPILLLFLKPRKPAAHPRESAPVNVGFFKVLEASLHLPVIWLIAASYFVCGLTDFFIMNHLVIYTQDIGFTILTGAWALSVFSIAGVVGTILLGGLSDSISPKILLGMVYLSRALGFFLLGFMVSSEVSIFLYVALIGFTTLATIPLTTSLTRLLFGQRHLGTIYGFFSMIHQIGAGVGTFFGGVIFDLCGNYSNAYLMGTILLILAGIASLLVRKAPFYWSENEKCFLLRHHEARPAGAIQNA